MSDYIPVHGQRPRRVTARMVAEAAGVSRSAVSRAFTDGAYLDDKKRTKIREVAAILGYKPNALAAGLQGGRSHLVAIFVGDMRSPYDTVFVGQLVGELNALNKWPILIDGGGQRAATAIEDVLRYPLDALILRGGSMSADIVSQCTKYAIPMISSGRPIEAPDVDNVCCRHSDGTKEMTETLIRQGRTRFGFLAGPADFYSSAIRKGGVLEALKAAGLSLVAESLGDYTVAGGHSSAKQLLSSHAIDALICANDAMAIGALTAAREMGLAVPKDLSVVGFDDISIASWPMFDLTTVRNPIDASVTEILNLLERRLATPGKQSETVFIDTQLVLRATH